MRYSYFYKVLLNLRGTSTPAEHLTLTRNSYIYKEHQPFVGTPHKWYVRRYENATPVMLLSFELYKVGFGSGSGAESK
jgi:hypothetical protein